LSGHSSPERGGAEVEAELTLRLSLRTVALEAGSLEDRLEVADEVDRRGRLLRRRRGGREEQDQNGRTSHGAASLPEILAPARRTRTATSENEDRGSRRDGAETQMVASTSPCGPAIGAATQ